MPERWKLKPLPQLRRALFARLTDVSHELRQSSAVVFAPHQDDECLGCGGTITLKREAGSPVKIVFMTDGSTSHRRFMSEDDLRRLRVEEALRAAESLGVEPADVQFLNFPDGRLGSCHDAAITQVAALLDQHHPDEIYVPYRCDGTPDHEATFRIVVEAVRRVERTLRVYEYPVWFWNQWPWVPLQVAPNRETIKTLCRMLCSAYDLLLRRRFRTGVFVGDVLDRKRLALAQHRSQTSVLLEGVGWPVLADISNGEFLNCFFQEFEVFHCWDSTSFSAPTRTIAHPRSPKRQ